MKTPSRRRFLAGAASASLLATEALRSGRAAWPIVPNPADLRIEDVLVEYEDYEYRTPIKFGGNAVDRATILNVHCVARTRDGRAARGFGSMPMGNVWSFPSRALSYDQTLGAMKTLAGRIRDITASYEGAGHPFDINRDLEPEYLKAAEASAAELKLTEPIPKLCTLVTASPFDAAIHDAFGKAQGLNCYRTYGPEFLSHDLATDLGPEFRGEYASQYVSERPKGRMPMYHLVGALDPIEESDIEHRVGDGLPETLPEWIARDGLTHLKIKLNGDDLSWDVDRVVRVERVAAEAQRRRGIDQWAYSLDFNERAPNVDYLLDFLRQLGEQSPEGFRRVQYIEQPTARDLRAHPENLMHEAAKVLPIVADESITDFESLLLARDRGYSGIALKACKGQGHAVLLASAAQKFGMFLCVQDLTCPGASLVHSAGLSAYIPAVQAIEANARQYMPAANAGWEEKFPGLFVIKDGTMDTSTIVGPGLGVV